MNDETDPELYLWGDTAWLCSSSIFTPNAFPEIPHHQFFDAYENTQALFDISHGVQPFSGPNQTHTSTLPTSGLDASGWMCTDQTQWSAYNQPSPNTSYPVSENFDLMSSSDYYPHLSFEDLGATFTNAPQSTPSSFPLNEVLPATEQMSLSPEGMLSPSEPSPFTPATDITLSPSDSAFYPNIVDPHQTYLLNQPRQGKDHKKEKGATCPVCGKNAPTKRDIIRHILGQHPDFAEAHNIKSDKTQCPFPNCNHWARIDNVKRHYKSRHKGIISWKDGCWSLIDYECSSAS